MERLDFETLLRSDLIIVLRIACFGKHLKNWIWILVMPHDFTSPTAATTVSTIGE